jgi:hypothetical protein
VEETPAQEKINMNNFIRIVLFLSLLNIAGCVYKHPTGLSTASRRCNLLTRWDDCAAASNCTQARAWYTNDGGYKETFICVYKHKRSDKKKK